MSISFAIFCKEHKEAIIIGKFGFHMYPGKILQGTYPFSNDLKPKSCPDESWKPQFDRIMLIVNGFTQRHPNCQLYIGTEYDENGTWPWGVGTESKFENNRFVLASGWIVFNIQQDNKYNQNFGKIDLLKLLTYEIGLDTP